MKIMCKQEYYDQVVQYAESIKDTSLQNCMERLEAWEKNPDRTCEIELYHDWAPIHSGSPKGTRTAAEELSEGCSITVHRMNRLPYS